MDGGGFEPPKQIAADLQSVPFGHSGIHPNIKLYHIHNSQPLPYMRHTIRYYSLHIQKMQAIIFFLSFDLLFKYVNHIRQIGICLVPDEFRTVPKIPRFGDFKGQSLEFPLTQITLYLIIFVKNIFNNFCKKYSYIRFFVY